MANSKFLLFDTNNEARMLEGNVKDGIATLDGKSFIVDESTPMFLKGTFMTKPLYIIKWSELEPATNFNPKFVPNNTSQRKTPSDKPNFPESKASKEVSPELLRKLLGIKILGNMIKPKRQIELGGTGMAFAGLFIGAIIVLVLWYIGVLPATPF